MNLDRLEKVIGKNNVRKLKNLNILIIGLGGVGGYALETLARNGIENFTIIDGDTIDKTNLNRQIVTNLNNIGELKTIEWKKRLYSINKSIKINTINKLLTKDDLNNINMANFNYIIDACDDVNLKVELIIKAEKEKLKLISSMGMGNKIDASKVYITKLNKTEYDPLAKKIRTILKKRKINAKTIVVSSKEQVNKNKIVGSVSHVPATAGIMITNYIFNELIGEENE